MATVTVSATTTTKVSPNIRFDPSYAKSIPGILKIAEAEKEEILFYYEFKESFILEARIVSLIGFICVQMVSNQYYAGSASGWFIFVAMTAFWVTLVVVVLYLFHIIEKLHWIPWLLGGFAALWAVFYFIAACVVVARSGEDAARSSGFLWFCCHGTVWIRGFHKIQVMEGWSHCSGRANNQHYNVHNSKLSDILKKSFSGSNQLLSYNH
ncbi:hypothetical protein CEXT_733181 [Caerostris extrusa]|uniref:MARVEL domain-containing protein n=1 Tax=Caerostris extrusa TaxID=172846 RepID=A0AAV4R1I2_CAEEX|nr:hypothetical protein CEXT_733181 [Caerostris extrusa]